ncbi:MAG: LCP family protein [Omnitrophica WOR_2 bacterium]
MQQTKNLSLHSVFSNGLLRAVLVVFILLAVVVGYAAFSAVHNIVSSGNILNPGSPEFSGGQLENTQSISETLSITSTVVAPIDPLAKPWDGASRVTILVMGLDYRDWKKKEGPPRTDSMMLLTLDPLTKTAGVLSIPRDLWVNIPGFGYYKINMAYYFGEGSKLPGGGPGLAVKTVEDFLGVPINYYAQIDFDAFVKFIDELDGITVDVSQPIKVDPIGKGNTVTLKPGTVTMDGELALAYVRVREGAGDDFGRAARQQQVLVSVRRRLLKLGPSLLPKAGAIYQDLSSGIHTNLSLDQAIQLGLLALQIDPGTYKKGIISPPDMVILAKSPDGTQDILKPISNKIRELRDQIFTTAIAPSDSGKDLTAMVKDEQARISILNASGAAGLAAKTSDYLKAQGANVVSTGDAGSIDHYTTLIYYTGKPYTLKYLVDLMKVQPNSIRFEYKPDSPVDIAIQVGADWAASNLLK